MSWFIDWANPHPNEKAMKMTQAAMTAFEPLDPQRIKHTRSGTYPLMPNDIAESRPDNAKC